MNAIAKIKRKYLKYKGKVRRKWLKTRLHPIHVFLFHQVSDHFDESTMIQCDWTETNQFKRNVHKLKEKYTFISLTEAYRHIKRDRIRLRNYAVMTSDDGWASLNNILSWLAEQNIPVTLFINPDYTDRLSFREKATEKYITRQQLESYKHISVGLHGLRHISVADMSESEFRNYVEQSIQKTSNLTGYVPFWAYTWGKYSDTNNQVLKQYGITPVYIDDEVNRNNTDFIERELLDGVTL